MILSKFINPYALVMHLQKKLQEEEIKWLPQTQMDFLTTWLDPFSKKMLHFVLALHLGTKQVEEHYKGVNFEHFSNMLIEMENKWKNEGQKYLEKVEKKEENKQPLPRYFLLNLF